MPQVWQDLAIAVLRDVRGFVERRENDYSWSSWSDVRKRCGIDGLIERLRTGSARPEQVAVLFAPTGPLLELRESSGWGEPFLEVARRWDQVLEAAQPVVRATFSCAACGRPAAEIVLHGPERAASSCERTSPARSDRPWQVFERLRTILAEQRADAVFELGPESAPIYCPTCARSYWRTDVALRWS